MDAYESYDDDDGLFVSSEDAGMIRLAEWAAEEPVGISNAMDRPWHKQMPPFDADELIWWCDCLGCGVNMPTRRHGCEDGSGAIYVGQCSKCQSINWTYVEYE